MHFSTAAMENSMNMGARDSRCFGFLAFDVLPLTVNELADLSAHQAMGGMSLLEGSIPLAWLWRGYTPLA